MFDTKTNERNDEGVSPVIGVILMVAITVILAAVIGAFVLDMAGNLQQNASASVQFSENTDNANYVTGDSGDLEGGVVTVRTVSMQKADFVEVRPSASSGSIVEMTGDVQDIGGTAAYQSANDIRSVGQSAEIVYENNSGGTVTIVGYLKGSGSVLQTYKFGAAA